MTILCYHTVEQDWAPSPLAVDPASFAKQCERWATQTCIPLERAVELLDASWRLPQGKLALTFDDGLSGVAEHAMPILSRFRLPATVFLVAETLTAAGRDVDWIDTLPVSGASTLTVDQVRDMQDAGVHFASHSYSHHDLTTLTYAQCVKDLRRSREVLEDVLAEPVRFLAYPRGRHDVAVRRAAVAAGYSHAFALPQVRERPSAMAIPRVGVWPTNGRTDLMLKTRRWYLPLRTSSVWPAARRAVAPVRSRLAARGRDGAAR